MGGTDSTKLDADSQSEGFVAVSAEPGSAPQTHAADGEPGTREQHDGAPPSESAAQAEASPPEFVAHDQEAPPLSATHEHSPAEPHASQDEPSLAESAATRQGPPPPAPPAAHEAPPPGAPDLVLDERLSSAAAPFLYLLAVVLVAVAAYLIYSFL